MDIEKQKKNVWQAAIIFLALLFYFIAEYQAGSFEKFYSLLLIPIVFFYAGLTLFRFLKLRKMKRQG